MSTNEQITSVLEELGLGTVEYAVPPGHIQILRDEDSNIVMVHWNIPLVAPATDTTPAVKIPPGKITLEGYGDIQHGGLTNFVAFRTTNWGVMYDYYYYLATGSFFCQDWGIKWQPAGIGPLATQIPRAIVDRLWTWTYPLSP